MPETGANNPKPRRRWLQFRLKTIFVVVAVLCVPLAWVGVRMNQKRQERAVIALFESLGGIVHYDWQGEWLAERFYVHPSAEPTGPGYESNQFGLLQR